MTLFEGSDGSLHCDECNTRIPFISFTELADASLEDLRNSSAIYMTHEEVERLQGGAGVRAEKRTLP